jgi:hypothetical protein
VWCLAVGVWTAPVFAAEKSAGDVAYDAFAKVRDNRDAKPNAARFEKLGQAGISFLIQHPTHRRAGSVISRSADYLPGKENQATRTQWLAQLRLAVVHATFDANLGNDAKAALLALDAAIAGAEVRDRPTRDNVGTYRERIDKLVKLEAFLKKAKLRWPVYHHGKPQEGDFAHKLNVRNLPAGYLFSPNGTLSRSGLAMRSVGGELRKYAAPVRK